MHKVKPNISLSYAKIVNKQKQIIENILKDKLLPFVYIIYKFIIHRLKKPEFCNIESFFLIFLDSIVFKLIFPPSNSFAKNCQKFLDIYASISQKIYIYSHIKFTLYSHVRNEISHTHFRLSFIFINLVLPWHLGIKIMWFQ